MNSTFSRAILGFLMLSTAIVAMSMVGLWAIETFTGGAWWASMIVVIFALGAEISVYGSTLHGPIYGWIKEPARVAKEARDAAHEAKREAARNRQPPKPPN